MIEPDNEALIARVRDAHFALPVFLPPPAGEEQAYILDLLRCLANDALLLATRLEAAERSPATISEDSGHATPTAGATS